MYVSVLKIETVQVQASLLPDKQTLGTRVVRIFLNIKNFYNKSFKISLI